MNKNIIHTIDINIAHLDIQETEQEVLQNVLKSAATYIKESEIKEAVTQMEQDFVAARQGIVPAEGGITRTATTSTRNTTPSVSAGSASAGGNINATASSGSGSSATLTTLSPTGGGVTDASTTSTSKTTSPASDGSGNQVLPPASGTTSQIYGGTQTQQITVPSSLQGGSSTKPTLEEVKEYVDGKYRNSEDVSKKRYWGKLSKQLEDGVSMDEILEKDRNGSSRFTFLSDWYDAKGVDLCEEEAHQVDWKATRMKMIAAIEHNLIGQSQDDAYWNNVLQRLKNNNEDVSLLFQEIPELFTILKDVLGLPELPGTIAIYTTDSVYTHICTEDMYPKSIGTEAIYGVLTKQNILDPVIVRPSFENQNLSIGSFYIKDVLRWIRKNLGRSLVLYSGYEFPMYGKDVYRFEGDLGGGEILLEKYMLDGTAINLKDIVFNTYITSNDLLYALEVYDRNKKIAIRIQATSYEGILSVVTYLDYDLSTFKKRFEEIFNSLFKQASNYGDRIDLLYEKAPPFIIAKKKPEVLKGHIDILLKDIYRTSGTNEDIGVLNILKGLRDQDSEKLFDYLYEKPEKVLKIYNTFSDTHKPDFIAVLTGLSQLYKHKTNTIAKSEFTILPDGYWLEKSILKTSINNGIIEVKGYQQGGSNFERRIVNSLPVMGPTESISVQPPQPGTDEYIKKYIEPILMTKPFNKNPMDFVSIRGFSAITEDTVLVNETQQIALFVRYTDQKLKNKAFWDAINVITSLLGVYGAVRVLALKGAGWLLKAAAIGELSKEVLELAMLSSGARDALRKAGLGVLVDNWTTISIVTDITFLSLDGLFALARKGRKGVQVLEINKYTKEAKVLREKTEQAITEVKKKTGEDVTKMSDKEYIAFTEEQKKYFIEEIHPRVGRGQRAAKKELKKQKKEQAVAKVEKIIDKRNQKAANVENELSHAATKSGVDNITKYGVDRSRGRADLDFNSKGEKAFYVHDNIRDTERYMKMLSKRSDNFGIEIGNVRFKIPKEELSKLNIKVFEEANAEWVKFVTDARKRRLVHNYDIVVGPKLGNYEGFINGKPAIPITRNGKLEFQIAFTTQKAVDVLNKYIIK